MPDLTIREVTPTDSGRVIHLVDRCFRHYSDQGVVLDLQLLDADLVNWCDHITAKGGKSWVVDHPSEPGMLAAMIGFSDEGQGVFELKRLYMDPGLHGSGLADRLMALVEAEVSRRGAVRITAWSDSRFTRAHRFYARRGYQRQAETRALNDPSNTTEFLLIKHL